MDLTRRRFGTAAIAATSASAQRETAQAAMEAVGVKPDDLIVKEVKVYVLTTNERIASIVTQSGIEGNYTLALRYPHPNWSNLGWLEYAKHALSGKSVLQFPEFTNQYRSNIGQSSYSSAINN